MKNIKRIVFIPIEFLIVVIGLVIMMLLRFEFPDTPKKNKITWENKFDLWTDKTWNKCMDYFNLKKFKVKIHKINE